MAIAALWTLFIVSSVLPSLISPRALHDALNEYTERNSSPLPAVLIDFLKEASPLPYSRMTSSRSTVNVLMNLLRVMRAEKVLDVGTYAGFSTLGMAIALPANGKVITMDVVDHFWNLVGRKYAQKANVAGKIDARVTTPANITLSGLIKNGSAGQFDLCYIDADKMNYALYYEQCLTLIRPLGIIAMDNVLWSNQVTMGNPASMDATARIFVNLNTKVAADQRVWTNLLAVGDGLSISIKKP